MLKVPSEDMKGLLTWVPDQKFTLTPTAMGAGWHPMAFEEVSFREGEVIDGRRIHWPITVSHTRTRSSITLLHIYYGGQCPLRQHNTYILESAA